MGLAALCPGTFDPVTNGHLDIIRRSARLFDPLVVGVLENPAKSPLFAAPERVGMLQEAVGELANVEVVAFSGLLVDVAKARSIGAIVKGVRAVTDLDYEQQMAQMNHRLSGVETLFMPASTEWSYLSSSLIKEVVRFGGDVSALVPATVADRLKERLAPGRSG